MRFNKNLDRQFKHFPIPVSKFSTCECSIIQFQQKICPQGVHTGNFLVKQTLQVWKDF